MGVADALFLADAQKFTVRSAVVIQSWDRTSNKGYPTVRPDYAMLWNEIMRQECLCISSSNQELFLSREPRYGINTLLAEG